MITTQTEKQVQDPTTYPKWRVKQDTLSSINSRRRILGLDLLTSIPQGTRNSSYDCPLAIATGSAVIYWRDTNGMTLCYTTTDLNADNRIPLSQASAEFVRRFDAGEFPEYER